MIDGSDLELFCLLKGFGLGKSRLGRSAVRLVSAHVTWCIY